MNRDDLELTSGVPVRSARILRLVDSPAVSCHLVQWMNRICWFCLAEDTITSFRVALLDFLVGPFPPLPEHSAWVGTDRGPPAMGMRETIEPEWPYLMQANELHT